MVEKGPLVEGRVYPHEGTAAWSAHGREEVGDRRDGLVQDRPPPSREGVPSPRREMKAFLPCLFAASRNAVTSPAPPRAESGLVHTAKYRGSVLF